MPKQEYEVLIEFKGGMADAKAYTSRKAAIEAYEAAKRRASARYVSLHKNGSMIASYGAAL
jgi:hypothetical protein